MDTLTLDKEQVEAQMAELDLQIATGEQAITGLTVDVARLRGKRQVWMMLAEALKERAD